MLYRDSYPSTDQGRVSSVSVVTLGDCCFSLEINDESYLPKLRMRWASSHRHTKLASLFNVKYSYLNNLEHNGSGLYIILGAAAGK